MSYNLDLQTDFLHVTGLLGVGSQVTLCICELDFFACGLSGSIYRI